MESALRMTSSIQIKPQEDTTMKTLGTKKGLFTGAAAGLFLFALAGMLPSSFIGGVIGLKIAGYVFGTAVESLVPRAMVGLSMLISVLTAGTVFVAASSLLGWLCGYIGGTAYNRMIHRAA